MPVEPLGEPIIIRFDGLDADDHTLELSSLSAALKGLDRIIAASANFAITKDASIRKDTQQVRVLARPPEDGCFVVKAVVQFAHQHPMFKDYAIATLSALTGTLITYIFARAAGKKEEMKLLSKALEEAIHQLGSRDQATVDRLLSTVEKMADNLRPAAKHAVEPIGRSARTLSVGIAGTGVALDEADKAAIVSTEGLTVGEEQSYVVLISELDMKTGACHVAVEGEGEEQRHPARITDPEFSIPNNVYVMAMAAKQTLEVRAKATFRGEEIDRLFISNHAGRRRGEPDFKLD